LLIDETTDEVVMNVGVCYKYMNYPSINVN
jgi:hypothetical protein